VVVEYNCEVSAIFSPGELDGHKVKNFPGSKWDGIGSSDLPSIIM